jgi:hypothetical protein
VAVAVRAREVSALASLRAAKGDSWLPGFGGKCETSSIGRLWVRGSQGIPGTRRTFTLLWALRVSTKTSFLTLIHVEPAGNPRDRGRTPVDGQWYRKHGTYPMRRALINGRLKGSSYRCNLESHAIPPATTKYHRPRLGLGQMLKYHSRWQVSARRH